MPDDRASGADTARRASSRRACVELRLLGGFEVSVDGRPVGAETIARRDPLRLIKFLALAPSRRAHREQLIDSLWPDASPDVLANRLHKAAHFVRKATGRADSVVLSGGTVALFPEADVEIDAAEFDRLARAALAGGDRQSIERAIARYAGDLLPYDLYEDWAFHHRQRLALRFRELLRAVGDFERLVAMDPTDEDEHVGIMRAMLRHGDRTGVLRQFDVLTRVLEHELGVGPSIEARAVRDLALGHARPAREFAGPTDAPPRAAALATQRVHFCTTTDGVRLAYAASGTGPPLVKAGNWLSHLDYDWDSPVWRHWWRTLSKRHSLVRYDERGCGLSDWDVDADSFSLEA